MCVCVCVRARARTELNYESYTFGLFLARVLSPELMAFGSKSIFNACITFLIRFCFFTPPALVDSVSGALWTGVS